MTITIILLIVMGVIGLIGLLCLIGVYNRLVTLRGRLRVAFGQVEVQLQRRYDLIPNLVETVKGYMTHEKETLEGVIEMRNKASSGLQLASSNPGDASAMAALMGAENQLGGALGRLFALAEDYPDLKANDTMENLQEELSSTENKVSYSRQAYNDSVGEYNIYKQTFPPVFFAGMFGHGQNACLLEFESQKISKAPKVEF